MNKMKIPMKKIVFFQYKINSIFSARLTQWKEIMGKKRAQTNDQT